MKIDVSEVKTIGIGILHRPSNICFGWEERRIAFIESLDGTTIPHFVVPHTGMRLVHQKI
jgi:gluconolactonase